MILYEIVRSYEFVTSYEIVRSYETVRSYEISWRTKRAVPLCNAICYVHR